MNKREKAMAFHSQGYNCAQSVFLAFCDDLSISAVDAARLSLPFGGGMGQMRETCGALTGAFMVLGMTDAAGTPPTHVEKAACYARVRLFAEKFHAQNGSMLCRELLAKAQADGRAKNCHELVGSTAEELEKFLNQAEDSLS
ncbi:MAG: C_GCAxxG_C_C family protein [Clostridia bacterium]|nr:C_GCAxxG_C_C family protein [Clostridia bacterium]